MSVGDPQMFIAVSLVVVIGLALNIAAAYRNWNNAKQNTVGFNLAHRLRAEAQQIRDKAVSEALQFRADRFKVCETCGKIVQGLCLECTAKVGIEE
jgi:hypothetical protein